MGASLSIVCAQERLFGCVPEYLACRGTPFWARHWIFRGHREAGFRRVSGLCEDTGTPFSVCVPGYFSCPRKPLLAAPIDIARAQGRRFIASLTLRAQGRPFLSASLDVRSARDEDICASLDILRAQGIRF